MKCEDDPMVKLFRSWVAAGSRSALVAVALACCAQVEAKSSSTYSYLGFNIDDNRASPDQRQALEAGLREQIDLVTSLPIDPKIAASLQSVPIRIDPTLREPGHYDQSGLRLWDKQSPPDNPVLLHQLLHAWLSRASGGDRLIIRKAYDTAVASGRYPRDAYMMSDVAEFFTMTTSVVLWGKAARLPFKRERVQAEMPDYYSWIVQRFGLRL